MFSGVQMSFAPAAGGLADECCGLAEVVLLVGLTVELYERCCERLVVAVDGCGGRLCAGRRVVGCHGSGATAALDVAPLRSGG